MITPFTDSGAVDHEKAWRLARHLSDHGSEALVVTGTTGESPTLSGVEKLALYKTVVDAVEGEGHLRHRRDRQLQHRGVDRADREGR